MQNRTLISWLVTGLLVMICAIGALWYSLSNDRAKIKILELQKQEINNLLASSQDTLKHYKDELGNSKATISILETYKLNTFLELQAKDKDILALQALVTQYKKQIKKPGDAAIILETETIIEKVVEEKIKEKEWEQRFISRNYKDEWVNLAYYVDKDSTGFTLKSTNKYGIVLGTDSKGKRFADVTNYNPYTDTKVFRTYQLLDDTPVQKKKRWGIGPSVGYFFTGEKSYLGIGASLNYNLFVW